MEERDVIMYFNKTIPELDVSNLDNTIQFYKTCGFKIKYEREENWYCQDDKLLGSKDE